MPTKVLQYQFSVTTTEPPTGSQARLNNADQTAATLLWLTYLGSGGMDVHHMLPAMLDVATELMVQDYDNAAAYQRYQLTPGADTDKGTHVEVPVQWLAGGQPLPNQKVLVILTAPDPTGGGGDGEAPPITATGAPTLPDVKEWLGLAADDTQDDALLQVSLDAALSAQATAVAYPVDSITGEDVFTADLYNAVLLRTQRLAARRNSPEGVVGLSGTGGDFVSARVPTGDPDVLRLEGPWLRMDGIA